MPTLHIRLLGGFSVSLDGHDIADDAWPSRKARQLVALLALAPGQQLARDQLLDFLWPDLAPSAAADALYHALLGARRVLDPQRKGLLPLRRQVVSLRPARPIWIDVLAFESAADAARRSGDPAAYQVALSLYTGELLPEEPYADWAATRRQSLREIWLALLGDLAALYERRGDWPGAIALLERAVSAEPAREETQAALMRVLALAGRRGAALRQYAQLRVILREDLDTDPDTETQTLYHAILADQFPPASSRAGGGSDTSGPRPTLPLPLSSLVGREQAIAAVRAGLHSARLVTLTGPGGVGKTRLALAVAHEVAGEYAGGVALAELAALSDGTLVPTTVAAALGIREDPGRPTTASLVAALTGRSVLLVLDNCEHLIDSCTQLAAELLAACPELRILATSRAPLQLTGELRYPVSTLPVPSFSDDEALTTSPATLAANPSAQLFVDRARLVRPGFEITADNAAALARVCVWLDGLPLAIELAAARTAHLSVRQIAARLDDAPEFLANSSPTAPNRQRTLSMTLDWSVALLAPPERALFERLSVFTGGWTLAAAEAVCADDTLPVSVILPLLAGLVDQSLVEVEPGPSDEVRYRLLEPIRQYAAERLAGASPDGRLIGDLRARHARCFLSLAEASSAGLFSRDQPIWLARLEAEHDNVRGALRWSLTHGQSVMALRLAGALADFWTTREHGLEGRRWLEDALRAPEAPLDLRARAQIGLAALAAKAGDNEAARIAARAALRYAEEAGIPSIASTSHRVFGLIASSEGDVAAAEREFEAALELLDSEAPAARLVDLLNDLALVARERGDVARAAALLDEAQRHLRDDGSPGQTARTLINRAFLAFGAREHALAGALLREALPRCRQAGAWRMAGQCLLNLGWIALQAGASAGAATAYADALRLVRASGSPRDIVAAIYGLALVAWERGDLRRAALLHGAVARLRELYQCPLTDADRALLGDRLDLTPMRAELGADAFAAAWAAGSALSLEAAIAESLHPRSSI